LKSPRKVKGKTENPQIPVKKDLVLSDAEEKNLARCTFDYFPVDDVDGTQMAMKAGDIVTLISTEDEEWWEVSNQKGDSGFIPKTYVELLVDAKQKRLCKALFDFVGKTPTELSISVGDLIHLISTEDDEWYEGRLNEKVGFFPKKSCRNCSNYNRRIATTSKTQTIFSC